MPINTDPVFHKGIHTYVATYIRPNPEHPGLYSHENEWELFLVTYHKTRNGIPVKAKKQAPRFKSVGFFPSLDACKAFLGIE